MMSERIEAMAARLEYLDDMYRLGQPVVTDEVYDALLAVLRREQPDHPLFVKLRAEPTYGDAFQEHPHPYPMLSLDNIFGNYPELVDWISNPEFSALNNGRLPRFVLEPKVDGMAIELSYVDGVLKHAVTRGDGEKGFDVVRHFRNVLGAPNTLKKPVSMVIRGELYVPKSDVPAGYKTARNAVAGLCRKHQLTDTEVSYLRFICYGHAGEGSSEHALQQARELGVTTTLSCRCTIVGNTVGLPAIRDLYTFEFALDADLDGVVAKIVDDHLVRELGNNGRVPRWAVAMKRVSSPVRTKLVGIDWATTRTGIVAPVGLLEPVVIGGVTVSRVNLHNLDFIRAHGAYTGAEVLVVRSAEVIPRLVAVAEPCTDANGVVAPTACPSCGGPVVNDGPHARCTAEWNCPEQSIQYLTYVTSKDALDIDGFGESTIREITERHPLRSPEDLINTLDTDVYDHIRNGATLRKNLEAALFQPMWRVVVSLGIPGVAEVTAKRMPCTVDPYELFNILERAVAIKKKRAEYLKTHRGWIQRYLPKFTYMAEIQGPLRGQVWCITGTLPEPKHHYAKLLEGKGARYSKTLSTDVTHLLVGESPGDKLKKATKNKLTIVASAEFNRYLTT